MNEYAQIIGTRHSLPFGRHYVTYEWLGKPTMPVQIAFGYEDEILGHLPWSLKEVQKDYCHLTTIYVRKDGALAIMAAFTAAKYWLRCRFIKIYHRLIITAMVWGLAYVPEAEVPSWKDIGRKP